jgi:hypothetical protein
LQLLAKTGRRLPIGLSGGESLQSVIYMLATTMEASPMSYKKATAALDEAARARLRGPFFGSTTPPAGSEDVDDDGLVELVDEFYNGYGEDAVPKEAVAPRAAAWIDTLRAALADATADAAAAARVRAEAERAVVDARTTVAGGEGVRKRVVERLRARGFDAGEFPCPPFRCFFQLIFECVLYYLQKKFYMIEA